MEPRGDALGLRCIGQHVARELLDDKLVKRLVGVKRGNYPIAIQPHHARRIVAVAVAVRITRGIQPKPPPTLTVMRRCQQCIDHTFVGIGMFAREKRIHFGRRGRQPNQVQINTS